MNLEIKNIRQIRVILTEILIILVNEHKIGNISVNITWICLIFCMSEQIFLRIHLEYFYNFIYFTYKILRVTRRYLRQVPVVQNIKPVPAKYSWETDTRHPWVLNLRV